MAFLWYSRAQWNTVLSNIPEAHDVRRRANIYWVIAVAKFEKMRHHLSAAAKINI